MFRVVARHFMMKCLSRRFVNRLLRQTGGERVSPCGASVHDDMPFSAFREPAFASDWWGAPFHGPGRGGLVPGHGVHACVRACPLALCVRAWGLALHGQ